MAEAGDGYPLPGQRIGGGVRDQRGQLLGANDGATRAGIDHLREYVAFLGLTVGLIALEALSLPELFASAAYDPLRPYLGIFGGAGLIAIAGAFAGMSRWRTDRGIAAGLLLMGLPASVLAITFLSSGSSIGGWSWSVLTGTSMGLGTALLAGRAPRWRPVPMAIGFLLTGDGVLMLARPGLFPRTVYGELVDVLLPFGVLLAAAGAAVIAGAASSRRGLALAGAGLAVVGLEGLIATFIATGLWVGVVVYLMLALFLVVAVLGDVTVRRAAIALLGLVGGLGAWMLVSHLRGYPVTDPGALLVHAAIAALVGAWLLIELRPGAVWPARALALAVLALAAADALWDLTAPGSAAAVRASLIRPLDSALVLALLATVLLAWTWRPSAGVVEVAHATTLTLAGTFALVQVLATTIAAGASPPSPILHLEQDQAFLLLGTAASLGLLSWPRGAAGPIQARIYGAVASIVVIAWFRSLITGRVLQALASPGDPGDAALLALTDRILGLLFLVLVLTLVGVVWVISGQIMRSMEGILDVARRRTAGERIAYADLAQNDELGELARALDAAAAARDRADEHAHVEHQHLRSVTTGSIEAFVALDRAGRIVEWNPQATAIFGWSESEVRGRSLADVILAPIDQEAFRSRLEHRVDTGHLPIAERRTRFPALHRDGHAFPAEIAINAATEGVEGASAFIRDISEAERQAAALRQITLYDPLTDLPNRTLIADRWQLAASAAVREDTRIGLAFLNIDHFKGVNDALGHADGDRFLAEVGRRLRAAVRGTDTVGRFGGDEFVAILSHLPSSAAAATAARSMLAALARPVEIDGRAVAIRASVGVVAAEGGEPFAEALRTAAVAMNQAKRAGGDQVVVYERSRDTKTIELVTLGADLGAAIEADRLRLVYEPVIDAASGRLLEVEALARWDHPERGPISPIEFVAIAERSGLINSLGHWVLERALDDLDRWRAAGLNIGVHVNVSVRQFGDRGFVDTVVGQIAARGIPRGALTVELTESLFIRGLPSVREDLVKLRAAGVRVSIDDFGTGFSAISYLHDLPIDEIKVDKSLILGAVNDARRLSLLHGLRDIAVGLDLAFVAEGVEDERTWDLLAGFGGARVQGFGIGRPMPAEALEGWVAMHAVRVKARRATRAAAAVARTLESAKRLVELSASTATLDDVLTNLWHEMSDAIPYDRIGVSLLEENGRTLRSRWTKASYGGPLRISQGYSAPMAGSSLEEILRTGRPRIIGDLAGYLARKPESMSTRLMVAEGVRSSLTCPLIVDGDPVGFMFFSSVDLHTYDDLHVAVFESLAALVSLAVARGIAHPGPRLLRVRAPRVA